MDLGQLKNALQLQKPRALQTGTAVSRMVGLIGRAALVVRRPSPSHPIGVGQSEGSNFGSNWVVALLAAEFLACGCASPNINPSSPRTHTGYIDLYADFSSELSWDVQRCDANANTFDKVFYQLEPLEGRILRLAFAPGRYRLRVTFLNRVITKPAEVEVEVQDGKITPVRVTLTEAGVTLVRTETENRGGTAKGWYGRRTKIGSDETVRYDLSAVADPPVAYQLKERMPYAR